MKKDARTSFGPGRVGRAVTCASLATLLVSYHPLADARQTDAADAPPLVVFAEYEHHADRAPLSADAAVALQDIRSDPAASDIRIGRSAPDAVTAALDARVLSVVVPASADTPETVLTFTGVDVGHNDENLVSLYAQDEATDSEVALVVQGADVLGSVRRGDETWKIHPLGGGLTAVYRYDTSQLRRHPPNRRDFMRKNELRQRQAPAAPPRDEAGASGAAADTGDVVDILVAYTPAARTAAGNIDTFIQFAIDNTHRIYRNSNIGFRLRLVHKHQTSYTQYSDMSMDLDRLAWTSTTVWSDGSRPDPDGWMDEIHGLRDRYGADLVALIVARDADRVCGVAYTPDFGKYPSHNFESWGFSVTAWNCETSTFHTFAHELGHNQGAHHDPDNTCDEPPCTLLPLPTFPYRYGRCNTAEGWNTIMSYSSNRQGDCRREIEYFSSPILNYRGTPTGDAARHDNRRVLLETARRVANYRQTKVRSTGQSVMLPLVPAAGTVPTGLVRVVNLSARTGTVRIQGIDDRGRPSRMASLTLGPRAGVQMSSHDLEHGNAGKGLPIGIGDGQGRWRIQLASELDIAASAYTRMSDGFLTGMSSVVPAVQDGANRWRVSWFNPASNTTKSSRLRLVNPGDTTATVTIRGRDDAGRDAPGGAVQVTLPPKRARTVTSQQLEPGAAGLTGRLGDGSGKWTLEIEADQPVVVMSLLLASTGHLSNLSDEKPTPLDHDLGTPPAGGPDLVVESPRISDATPTIGQSVTGWATVRNAGNAPSTATTLRFLTSLDASIGRDDSVEGVSSVRALAPGATQTLSLTATVTASAGTYYVGACVDPVSGESDTANNCSSAVRVVVGAPPTKWERSGTGAALFDLPIRIERIRIVGEYHGFSENFVVWCGGPGDEGGLLVNELMGTGWGQTRYSGFHSARRRYNGYGEPCRELHIEDAQGVRWTVTEFSSNGALSPTAGTGDQSADRAAVERARAQVLRSRVRQPGRRH